MEIDTEAISFYYLPAFITRLVDEFHMLLYTSDEEHTEMSKGR